MTEFDPKAHVTHMAPVMGLTIPPEWRDGVEANVAATARMAALVLAFPLPDEVEPAAVYEAGR
ncbi:DUF4089 domain-containing protein [Chthonobacter rhizosphaerae]|uniref:DUF4089 domain-containing protein n=1 Tax=Chthonobacter rhizosphaerae TaxID=2735553 RepID=UPI0015EF5703|nr:DUF4089 domain-containing protein [Chthonobacter rhizosphaerae]